MFRVLIDTCVWLDLAKDPKQLPILSIVEELLRLGNISLIVPRIVLDEFQRNRERIAKESAKSLSAHFRLVKEAVSKLGGDKEKMQVVLSHLDDVNHKIPIIGGEAVSTLDRIEKLLTTRPILETSESVKLRAAQRAIEKKAPFHHDKNSMADAILIETYADCRTRQGSIWRSASRLSRITRVTSASSTAITNCLTPILPTSSQLSNPCTSSTWLKHSAMLSLRS
jgi:hypothetical protein